ncbi:MAG: hypothetical protein WEA09_10855 [Gemmatimonadota bacterium]
MRDRTRVLGSLERVYTEAFQAADRRGDDGGKERLDLEYQRDQLFLEALLDIRELLTVAPASAEAAGASEAGSAASSLLEKAEALRRITRLR